MIEHNKYDRDSEIEELGIRAYGLVDDIHDNLTYAVRVLYDLELRLDRLFNLERHNR